MGTDIDDFLEVRGDDGHWHLVPPTAFPAEAPWESRSPLTGIRSYSIFAFIAGVRNESHIEPLAPMRGLPTDLSDELAAQLRRLAGISAGESWLTLAELLAVDYDQIIECRRWTAPNLGPGRFIPLRDFLSAWFVDRIHWLQRFGPPDDVRIVFQFNV